jgi:2-oxoglutarate ferredoxin oxidoreductase subunit alpha
MTTTAPARERVLMEGSEALARASIAAGCRFFAGYPMTPFTEVLEHFARLLPGEGGVCINAESELEAVGMAWGALSTGARAATGSTGQGLSLMQESFSEITLAELPLVVFNMARGQQDYYQATRGGGHGDYRHIVLAPQDVSEGVELVQLAFHLADKWRNPALLYGDYLLAHTQEALAIERLEFPELPAKDWAVDGSLSGSGGSRAVTPLGVSKVGQRALGQEGKAQYIATKLPLMEREVRVETGYLDDAETVIVAFGSPAKFAKYAINQLRAAGHKIGYVRPITLWPFPYQTVADAASGAHVRRVGSFELSAGQMVDDVRIGVAGRVPVEFIGGVSTDHSGFGVGRILDVEVIAERLLALHQEREQPVIPGYEVNSYELQAHQTEATR